MGGGSPMRRWSEVGLLELVKRGATEGQTALALPSSRSPNLDAARIWSLEGSEAYSLFQIATEHPEDFAIEFDVTIDLTEIPSGNSTTLLVSLEDDSELPVIVDVPVATDGDGLQTSKVAVSFDEFGELSTESLFYELKLGTSNSWDGEILIDNLRLRSKLAGDITNEAILDCNDMDALSDAVRHGFNDEQYDLTDDGIATDADRGAWLNVVGSVPGDFDLNGVVEFADFLILSETFGIPGNWCEGDANGDREIDFSDFLVLADSFGRPGALLSSVPEPRFNLAFAAVLVLAAVMPTRSHAHERR